MSRKTEIEKIKAAIMHQDDDEDIVLHVPEEFDQRYMIPDRSDFLDILQLRYANLDKKDTFKLFMVNQNLKMFTATLKDRRYGIIKLPPNECRLYEKEIAGQGEFKSGGERDNSEEEYKKFSSTTDSEPDVADERKSRSKTGEISLDNSRTSIDTIHEDIIKKTTMYNTDDLVRRESMMIFSSKDKAKELTLEDFEIIDFLGQGTFGKVYLTKLK